MVGRTGKENLKRMCLGLNALTVEVQRAKRVRELLKNFELDEIRDVSAGAATFYVWVRIESSRNDLKGLILILHALELNNI